MSRHVQCVYVCASKLSAFIANYRAANIILVDYSLILEPDPKGRWYTQLVEQNDDDHDA